MVDKVLKILSIVLLILFFISPAFFRNIEEQYASEKKTMIYDLHDVVIVGHEDGKKHWMLKVKKITDQGKDKTLLHGLEQGEIYNGNGEIKYILQADSGEYFKARELLTLENNILVTSKDGEIMKTDTLEYDKKSDFLTTGAIEIKKEDLLLYASEMRLNVDEEIFNFSGEVTLEFEIEDENQEEGEVEANEKIDE